MTMQFGRYGLDITAGEHTTFGIGRKPTARMTAGQRILGEDDVTIGGWITAGSQADALALQQQLHGHFGNVDEPQVPFIWGTDPSQVGYVVPIDIDFSAPLGVSYTANGQYGFQYQLKAQRAGAYSVPRHQALLSGAVRVNAQSVVSADTTPWHGFPASATGYDFAGRTDSFSTRVGPGGTWNHLYSGQAYFNGVATWTIPPASYYDMSACLKAGSTLHYVVGRQFNAAANLTQWEVGNGLFKIGPGSGSALLQFTSPLAATPGTWGTPVLIDVGYFAGGSWYAFGPSAIKNVSVLRNSPAVTILRLTVSSALAALTSYYTVDITVRQGDRGATITVKSPQSRQWGIGTNAATATADLLIHTNAYGIRRTANDADGNRICLMTAQGRASDLVNGRLYLSAGSTAAGFGLFSEINATSPAVQDSVGTLTANWFAAQNLAQRIVRP